MGRGREGTGRGECMEIVRFLLKSLDDKSEGKTIY